MDKIVNFRRQTLAERCMIHAQKMSEEGWHTTANVLFHASQALRLLGYELPVNVPFLEPPNSHDSPQQSEEAECQTNSMSRLPWPYGSCELSADIPCNPFNCCEICQVPGAGKHPSAANMLAALKEIETAGLRGYLTPELCADIVTRAIAKAEASLPTHKRAGRE